MTTSMLAAVHAAMNPPSETGDESETGATATVTEEGKTMTTDTGKPAAGQEKTVTQAEHDAAVATARTAGYTDATARFAAILGAEGIKGDAARMTAAMDLATKSPDMKAEEVAAFVTANVAAAATKPQSSYSERRQPAAGLAAPVAGEPAHGNQKAAINSTDIYARRRTA